MTEQAALQRQPFQEGSLQQRREILLGTTMDALAEADLATLRLVLNNQHPADLAELLRVLGEEDQQTVLQLIAEEIVTLQRTEVAEVEEPFIMGKVGSSTIPGAHGEQRRPPPRSLGRHAATRPQDGSSGCPRYRLQSLDGRNDQQLSLKEALLAEPLVASRMTPEEMDALLDPWAYVGLSGEFVDRVVAEAQLTRG